MNKTFPLPDPGTSASDRVDQELSRILADPAMQAGSRLPTERALAEGLRVPRSAVRTALTRLAAHGRVTRIIGSGTYVAEGPHEPAEIGGSDASPLEIMEARLLVEPKLAPLVIARANSADISRIRAALQQAEAATDFQTFEIWDGQFHQAIAEATHNRLMIAIYGTITSAREFAEWGELKRRSINDERRRLYILEHAQILSALQARDAARAEAALEAHLLTVRKNLFDLP